MSTRMQMEILARQQAEIKNRTLEQRIMELEERMAQGRSNVEGLSQHGSNSRQYASPTPEAHIGEAHNAPPHEEYDNYVEDGDYDQYGEEDENFANDTHDQVEENLPPLGLLYPRSTMNMTTAPTSDIHPCLANDTHVATEESLLPPRPVAARSAINMTTATNDILPCFANDTNVGTGENMLPHRHDAAQSHLNKTTTPTNGVPSRFAHDDLVGKDVILFTILKSELAAARGTVISTNLNTMVGGQSLGNEYCEVVVNVVMKRDAMLPRTYGGMKTMASALKMSIAWPYNKECKKKECNKGSRPLMGTAA